MSRLRKIYMLRFVGRCVALVIALCLCIWAPSSFEVLEGMRFFTKLSPLHLMWAIWVMDVVLQMIPAKSDIALGSKKLFKQYFTPAQVKHNWEALKKYIATTTKRAYKILVIWTLLIAGLGVLHNQGIIGHTGLFMVSVVFYVCDLICVLFWCPFRLMMKNRCCTTCRIFNWDHMMMFTPMVYVFGFYSYSLLALAAIVWVAWELTVLLHPERFWFSSNESLKCVNCTDKLCTQYCQKLRAPKKD